MSAVEILSTIQSLGKCKHAALVNAIQRAEKDEGKSLDEIIASLSDQYTKQKLSETNTESKSTNPTRASEKTTSEEKCVPLTLLQRAEIETSLIQRLTTKLTEKQKKVEIPLPTQEEVEKVNSLIKMEYPQNL